MSIGIGENLTGSFGYAKDKLVGNIGNWILLIILTIIPIIDFIAMGTYLKVYRGEDPKVEHIGKSFIDGLLVLIIGFLYMLIPFIIIGIIGAGSIIPAIMSGSLLAVFSVGAGVIALAIILILLFALFMIPAMINFARKGFGAAFHFGEIIGMISKVGWLKYIISIILLAIILVIIVLLLGLLLGWIPVIGGFLIGLIMLIIYPFLIVWASKFWANLFE
ncbi:MAG: DUF4013 domain-containing protein [Methanocorpusculum sp.]|jgi:hypothetical protein|nr:DUF4013 domain-containing protein [Methanocorpusculum sp.]